MNEHFEPGFCGAAEIADGTRLLPECQAAPTLQDEGRLRVCAWCRRVSLRGNNWVDADSVAQVVELISQEIVDEATHGICPDCFNHFLSGRRKTSTYFPAAEVSRFASASA
jgi:hypothetical protein